jgi:CTP:molybdopterin cytidylyltransferase MocA
MPETALLVAILAAGASRRLGTAKQLVRVHGQPLIRRQCRVALAANIGSVVVVLGCQSDRCSSAICDLPVQIRVNAGWLEGIASSLRCAVAAAIAHNAGGLLILPCDQFRITSRDLRALVDRWHQSGGAACVSRFDGQTGPPVIVPAAYYGEVQRLHGDAGARAVLRDPRRVPPIEVDNPHAAFDLDRIDDLRTLGAA